MSEDSSGDVVIEPTTVELYGADGRVHHTAAGSKFATDGLKDGSLSATPPGQPQEEVSTGGTDVSTGGDGSESGGTDGGEGSGNGETDSGGTGSRRRRSGTA
jgi:hypothetical protein